MLVLLMFAIIINFSGNTKTPVVESTMTPVPPTITVTSTVKTAVYTQVSTIIMPTSVPIYPQEPLDIGNPVPEGTDDRNVYNGYWWNGEGWTPGLPSFETQFLRMPSVSIGSALFYAPDVMRANAEYRELSLDGVMGAVSIQFCSEIGHKVWLQRPGYDWEGPFMVADCSRRNDLYGHIMFRDQVVEVDFDTAVRWGMARYGGQQNEGRWSTLTGRMNNVLVSKYDPDFFDGNIVDLSVWFLENVRFAKITENAYSLQNYIPPNHNEIELGIDNRGNDFPLWLINGKRITFP